MRYEVTIKTEPELYDLFKDYAQESPRSTVQISKGDTMEIKISSDDSVALRASFNGITKLFTAYEKLTGVTDGRIDKREG